MYEQHHLHTSINFSEDKIKPSTLTVGKVNNILKGTIERFVASDNAFSFMSSVKGTPRHWKHFLNDVLATVKYWEYPHIFQYLWLGIFNIKYE